MDHKDLFGLFATLGTCGGISLIIWTSVQAKIAKIKAEAQSRRQDATPSQDGAVLAELKALKQQMAEMHSTSHGFDISFDEALGRLEGRVGRLETKSAAGASTSAATSSASADAATLRNGQGQ
jgi:hypothetical protein